METLQDRVAIVTGGTSGIGRATALELARRGAAVVVVGRNPARIDETVRAMGDSGGAVAGLALDVSREADMDAMADRTLERFGRIDILVACAASAGSSSGLPYTVAQMPVEDWDRSIDVNLKGMFFSNRAALRAMIRQRGGDIVNVSSARGGVKGLPCAAAYAASKHGVMGLSRSLAEEVRKYGVRVQVVLPDVTDTPMMAIVGDLAPQGMLKPETMGTFIADLVCQPRDGQIPEPWVMPFSPGVVE
jgi:NAD(P)-dependent dehydrogenase (short-subunit alcohol dehydrogenase family)